MPHDKDRFVRNPAQYSSKSFSGILPSSAAFLSSPACQPSRSRMRIPRMSLLIKEVDGTFNLICSPRPAGCVRSLGGQGAKSIRLLTRAALLGTGIPQGAASARDLMPRISSRSSRQRAHAYTNANPAGNHTAPSGNNPWACSQTKTDITHTRPRSAGHCCQGLSWNQTRILMAIGRRMAQSNIQA